MDVFERKPAAARRRRGPAPDGRPAALAQQHRCVAQVRGLGAMVAMELCQDGNPHRPDAALARPGLHMPPSAA